MGTRIDEFREFVKTHPLLKEEVKKGSSTWQNLFEEWTLYGESDSKWSNYIENNKKKDDTTNTTKTLGLDNIKNVFGYVKKINPDNLNKTLNNVQKVIQIAQTVGGGKSVSAPVSALSTFSDWWD